jgi:hypothetical protein
MGRKRRKKSGGKGAMHVVSPHGGQKQSAVATAIAKSVRYRPFRTAVQDLEGEDLHGVIQGASCRLASGRLTTPYPSWLQTLGRQTRHKILAAFAVQQAGYNLKRFSGTKIRLFHGTPVNNIALITCSTLRASTGGLFGAGVYLTPDIHKALGFASGEMELDGRARYVRTVLVCDAKLGKVLDASEREIRVRGAVSSYTGYDSVLGKAGNFAGAWGGSLRWSEYCVKNAGRVSVTHVLVFG